MNGNQTFYIKLQCTFYRFNLPRKLIRIRNIFICTSSEAEINNGRLGCGLHKKEYICVHCWWIYKQNFHKDKSAMTPNNKPTCRNFFLYRANVNIEFTGWRRLHTSFYYFDQTILCYRYGVGVIVIFKTGFCDICIY